MGTHPNQRNGAEGLRGRAVDAVEAVADLGAIGCFCVPAVTWCAAAELYLIRVC